MADKKISQVFGTNPITAPKAADLIPMAVDLGGGNYGSGVAQVGKMYPPDYLTGLRLERMSDTSVKISSGWAMTESGTLLKLTSAKTLSGITKKGTMYYLYLYDNSGAADVEISETSPAAPYFGNGQSKTGAAARRLIGWLHCDSSLGVLHFYPTPAEQLLAKNYSGVWTPELVMDSNIASTTAYEMRYTRMGNIVTFSGLVRLTSSSAGAFTLSFKAPIPSNFGDTSDCSGNGLSDRSFLVYGARPNVTNKRIEIVGSCQSIVNIYHRFVAQYKII